jgi:hypothetical protein
VTPVRRFAADGVERIRQRILGSPIFLWVLGVYAATRIWGWVVFSLVGRQQQSSPWGSGPLSYLQFIAIWDGDWYRHIAQVGYPTTLPVDLSGSVDQNPWAFYPLFPMTVSGLMRVTGLSWPAAGGLVSIACGAVASILLYGFFTSARAVASRSEDAGGEQYVSPRRILHGLGLKQPGRGIDRFALWSTALVLLNPIAPILQVPYAESMNFMFLAGFLLALVRGNLVICSLVLIPTCLSRPVGVPVAAALGFWWLTRFVLAYRERSSTEGFARFAASFRRTARYLGVALFACVCALAWPGIAWIATGRYDAYTSTETAWRGEHLLPVQPWIDQSLNYFGAPGPLILLILVLGFLWVMHSRVVLTTLPRNIRYWCYAYVTYLLIFLFPQSSTFRLLLPVFPLAAPLVALSESRAYRATLLIGAALGQLIWVGWLWHWKELPSGGDYPP